MRMKKILSLCISFTMLWMFILEVNIIANAKTADIQECKLGKIPKDYTNAFHDLTPIAFGTKQSSFLKQCEEGGYELAVYQNKLYVNKYDSAFHLKSSKSIKTELPLWGGIYLGDTYNYVVCGQVKRSYEENGGETYRIIKYDKEFNRVDSISLNSQETYTTIPFEAGNVSIAECENILTIHTSRVRLDGHQSNIIIHINTEDMTIMDLYDGQYVSHSFRQIVKYDKERAVYVDLSDAYPERSVYLQSEFGNASLIEIEGEDGEDITHTDVSGLEISDTGYLVVGTRQKNGQDNIYLSRFIKENGEVEQQWLTNHVDASATQTVGNARIVKTAENKFVVLWTVLEGKESKVNYVVVDGAGNIIGEKKEVLDAEITDCMPIYEDGSILWSGIKNGKVVIYKISDF